jgi:hypothetical protein
VAERYKARICGLSFAGISGLSPTAGMGVCLFVSVLCCQVEVYATGRSLVQRSPTYCGVSLCVIYKPEERNGSGTRWVVVPEKMSSNTAVPIERTGRFCL